MPARRRAAGFTLIELMVVVAILGILTALAAPSLSEVIASQRVSAAATDLHLALLKARAEAIKRNTAVTLSPVGGSWAAGWSIIDPESPSGPALDTRSATVGVSVTTSLSQIIFRPNGRITSTSDATFVIASTSTTQARCVLVDPSGRPYSKKGATC